MKKIYCGILIFCLPMVVFSETGIQSDVQKLFEHNARVSMEAHQEEIKRKKDADDRQKDIDKRVQHENIKKEQSRVNELRGRKYSKLPAKISVQHGGTFIKITSIDDSPFLFERLIVNNRFNNSECNKGPYVIYMMTGDSELIPIGYCGSQIVKVEVHTNRGISNFSFSNKIQSQ